MRKAYKAPDCSAAEMSPDCIFLASNYTSGHEDLDDISGGLDWDDLSL